MRAETRNGLAGLMMVTASLCVGAVVWLSASHVGLALICGLLALLGLVSAYSLLAHLLGWPPPKWSDVWAIGYLLP
ncbi:hypothetical protein [Methylobacterium sp. R2-1]|uniref:hypothetical protein n=1 Tax=Methylobacterium sp. R2-1 TaxID=2587064 RepID=UPI001618956D|nr:hypothetical protein [Methylobacterium sp. R2-1]MBB2962542.1 CHASE2 domain-containing sensor protein [Methylobacterium sp. R2-1]